MCGHLRLPVDKEATWGGVITVPDDGTTLHRVDWTNTFLYNSSAVVQISAKNTYAALMMANTGTACYAWTTSKNTMYITHVSGDDLGASGGIAQFYFSIYAGPGTAVTAVF
jgi:hypothetical protein